VFRDSRNTTGVLGVSRSVKQTPAGIVSESYAVTWRPNQACKMHFLFHQQIWRGKAFKLAVSFRIKKLREIHGGAVARKLKGLLEEKGIAV